MENWEPCDPSWLVTLAREQHPSETWLPSALSTCTRCWRESKAYVRFVNSRNPNEPGSDWQFLTNLTLESVEEGFIVLDILQNHRVGGVEFVDNRCGMMVPRLGFDR